MSGSIRSHANNQRDFYAWWLRERGISFTEIGQQLGITRQRVGQMWLRITILLLQQCVMTSSVVPTKTDMQRFMEKIDTRPGQGPQGECHQWTAGTDGHGYGSFWFRGRMQKAQRVAWILRRGEIPAGLCALHSCDNPLCVRDEHLFLGTKKDNSVDAMRKGRLNESLTRARSWAKNKTHCVNGHELNEENTYRSKPGRRRCRICQRDRSNKRSHGEYLKRKANGYFEKRKANRAALSL
jgi:hypothetical protein